MRSSVSLVAVSVLFLCVGRGYANGLYSQDFENLSGELAGQDGWFLGDSDNNEPDSTRDDGTTIGERDGNKFLDGFAATGGFVTLLRPLNLFSGTGIDEVEMTWTLKAGFGDYPEAGNRRSHNMGMGFHRSSDGSGACCGTPTLWVSTTIPDEGEGDPTGSVTLDVRQIGTNQSAVADDMFGQESGFLLRVNASTGEVASGYDPGLTGSYTMFDSFFVDPAQVQGIDHLRIFIDNRGDWAGYEVDNIVVTPEPASLALVGMGALTLLIRNRRQR